MHVAANDFLQGNIASWVRQGGPQRTSGVTHLYSFLPQQSQFTAVFGRAEMSNQGAVTLIQIALKQFGQAVAVAAFGHGTHMHFIVIGHHRLAHGFIDQPP